MSTARIPPLDPPYQPEVGRELAKLAFPGADPLRLFRTLAHNPRVLGRFRKAGLLDPGSISAREREIVIHRVCARCGSEYEWGVHAALFAGVLTEEQRRATLLGSADDPAWGADESLLVRLADELHDQATISDGLWKALSERWSPAQLVELVVLAGFYHTVSFVTNAFRVELETEAARFPSSPSSAR